MANSYLVIIGPEARLPLQTSSGQGQADAANFRKANLTHARLNWANLQYCDLSETKLSYSNFENANLILANLSNIYCHSANFSHANLQYVNFRKSVFVQSNFHDAWLHDADLTETVLWSDISGALLRGSNLERTDVTQIKYSRNKLKCKGIHVDSCYGNALFRRDAQDQDWIESFREQSKAHYALYWIWRFFTDCGRSLLRVAILGLLITSTFGYIYQKIPDFKVTTTNTAVTWFTPYYSSIMIFTSLGTGDIVPQGVKGQLLITAEIVLGYLTLGLLISILANKVARRS